MRDNATVKGSCHLNNHEKWFLIFRDAERFRRNLKINAHYILSISNGYFTVKSRG